MAFSYAELMMERMRLKQRLVVSEAENARLREALERIRDDILDCQGASAVAIANVALKETDNG